MGRWREIRSLVASIATLLAMGAIVAQDATAQEIPLPNAEAYYYRGNAYQDKVDSDRAIADYTRAIQLNPKYVKAYVNRGVAYSNKGDNKRAIADFTQAIQLDPKFAKAYIGRGSAYYRKGDIDRAMADYNQAIQVVVRQYSEMT